MIGTARARAFGASAVTCVADHDRLRDARRELVLELWRVDDVLASRFCSESELTALNRAAGCSVRLSPELFDAVAHAPRVAAAPDGLGDATVGRAFRLAGYEGAARAVRERDSGRCETMLPPGGELDLGAIAEAATPVSGGAVRVADKYAAPLGLRPVIEVGAGGWSVEEEAGG